MKAVLSTLLVFVLLVSMAPAGKGVASPHDVTITVDTLIDAIVTDGYCSLREAVIAANTNAPYDTCPGGDSVGTDTIVFAVSGTINASNLVIDVVNAGPLAIDGGDQIELSGQNMYPISRVQTGGELIVRNLKFSNGYVPGSGGHGGGLINDGGSVLIDHCVFYKNTVGGTGSKGGAVYSTSASGLTIYNSVFEENSADLGGAIYNEGSLSITVSTFLSNSATAEGGAVYTLGHSQINLTTFTDNVAYSYGGAIQSYAPSLSVTNSTFDKNMVFSTGGAIMCSYGTCTIEISRFTGSVAHSGGAICLYTGNLYVSGSSFKENAVSSYGGAIELWNSTDFSISTSTFESNSADGGGGVMVHHALGTISDSIFRKNYGNLGGGIFQNADDIASSGLSVERTTFWENNSPKGGAIYNKKASLKMVNDTLASNTATEGGGVYNDDNGVVVIYHSTLAHNSAVTSGDQLYNPPGLGEMTVVSSILAYPGNGQNCYGAISDEGMNIDSGYTCAFIPNLGSMPNTDPLLGPLQDNGGPGAQDYPTLTFALQYGSPAINRSKPDYSGWTDQRGFPRRAYVSDIGAYEAQPFVFNIISGDWQSTDVNTPFPEPLVMEAQCEYGNRLAGVPVTFAAPAHGPSIANNPTYLVTDENGYLSFQAIANDQPGGPYEVWGAHSIGTVYTTFHLTNLGERNLFLPMVIQGGKNVGLTADAH